MIIIPLSKIKIAPNSQLIVSPRMKDLYYHFGVNITIDYTHNMIQEISDNSARQWLFAFIRQK